MCQQNTCDQVREKNTVPDGTLLTLLNKLSKEKNMDPVWVLST